MRERVAVLRAGGMDREEIADAIGCCEKALRTYFLPELNEGKSAKRAEVVAKLFEMAIGGSVPAMKAFLALGVKADAIPRAEGAQTRQERAAPQGCGNSPSQQRLG